MFKRLWIGILIAIATTTSAARAEWSWALDASRAPQLRTMRQWAEEEIRIPNGPFEGEPFRADLIPWTRLFLDEVDSGRWQKIAGTGCTQAGKTLVLHAIPVLYHLFEVGETVVEGVPDMYMGADKWREDLLPVIQSSPSLRSQLPQRGAGSRGGKAQAIQFRHGATLRFMTGGGSDAGRKGFTSRVLAVTEVDELAVAGGTSTEADKLTQLEGRLRAFLRLGYREYLESTPTVEAGRIWQVIKQGTDSRIVRPCPHCGVFVTPEREHLVGWQDAEDEHEAKALAAWSCPHCGERWTEAEQLAANQAGELVHRGQTVTDSGRVEGPLPRTDTFGFRFSAVDNYFVPAGVLGQELWRAARAVDQDNAERYLAQQVFALPWSGPDIDLAALDPAAVSKRRGGIKRGIVPEDCLGIGIGIDTGKRLLHWTAMAVCQGGRRHVIDYGEQPTQWQTMKLADALVDALGALADYFDEGWRTLAGQPYQAAQVWIDSGYYEHTEAVYAFCRNANAGRHLAPGRELYRPAKGWGEGPEMAGRYHPPKATNRDVRYVGPGYHLSYLPTARQLLVHVDADTWKSALHNGLSTPADEPSAITLYDAADLREHDQWSSQVSAEEREETFTPRGIVRRWVRKRRKNHFLDASYNATAACDLIRRIAGAKQAASSTNTPAASFTTPAGLPFLATERS
jgi:phage terminase large subunit GpA-like protein